MSIHFDVPTPEGAKEHYILRYDAILWWSIIQEGEPADPLKARFIDTRRCSWQMRGIIIKRFYFVNQFRYMFAAPESKYFYPDNMLITNGSKKPGTCQEIKSTIDGDANDVTNRLKTFLKNLSTKGDDKSNPAWGIPEAFKGATGITYGPVVLQ